MVSIRDRFRGGWNTEVTIFWEDKLEIEDVIYMSITKRKYQLDSKFRDYFNQPVTYAYINENTLSVIKEDQNDVEFDKRLLLFWIAGEGRNHEPVNIMYHIPDSTTRNYNELYRFQDGFLQLCWDCAKVYGVRDRKFGKVIRSFGFKTSRKYKDFEATYLGQNVPTKSARSG